MEKTIKRYIAIMLTLLMFLSTMPFDVFAAASPAIPKNSIEDRSDDSRTQYVEFVDEASFSTPGDSIDSSKPKDYYISTVFTKTVKFDNAKLGSSANNSSTVYSILGEFAKTKAKEYIIAKIGAAALPVVSYILTALWAYCTYQLYQGYKYTKITIICEKWAIYKHQGGNWVKGIGYKIKLTVKGAN